MQRWVYAYATVVGDVNQLERRFQERIRELLQGDREDPEVDEQPPAADGSYRVRLDSKIAGLPAAKEVRVSTGVARTGD
jgi:hypothetical protein